MMSKPAPKKEEENEFESGSDTETESEEDEDTGLTENQNRLLYMISLYTRRATPGTDEKDQWVRKPALIVLIYEGIVAGVLDFDYAPASALVGNRRIWMNVSQEGKSDIEFLREEELVNGLQMASKSFQPLTCFQISDKGKELVKRISRKEKEAVHEFVYARGTRELLTVNWDGRHYYLISSSGYRRKSTITECEDVSYVSSAYIPQCLRYGGRPTLSNAHRAHESGVNVENNLDELDEVITLNSVSVIVAEYIPFGANQIVQLNNNVGSTERCQGGFISPAMDTDSSSTQIEMSPELTSVDILDYTLTNHINFEAEINFANDGDDVVQVETFGVSLNAEGTCFYGLQVEAVVDRIKDNISLDHLSRLLVDVQQDSSAIVDAIISQYQRDMMNLVFLGDAENRNKVNLLIANEITPHLTAEEYMDKGEYENELKQVIGDTKAAYDISEHDTLIFGAYGLLLAGPNSRHHEPLLCAYLQFITIDIFLQNFFSRIWILNDDMQTTNKIILEGEKDPRALNRIRYRICKLAKDIIMLEEILSYMLEALEIIEIPPEPPEQAGRALYERLEIAGMRNQLVRRAMDLKKNIAGSHRFLDVLREMSAVVSESKMFLLNESVDLNTKRMCSLQESNEKAAASLQILQFIFGGILAFDILDRLTGNNWTVTNSSWFSSFYETAIVNTPLLWFLISLFVWGLVVLIAYQSYRSDNYIKQGLTTIRLKINRKVFLDRLQAFLRSKLHSYEDRQYDDNNDVVRITYIDNVKRDWGGSKPTITLEYDERNAYLFSVTVQYNRRKARKALVFNAEELREKIMDELNSMDVWDVKGEDRSDEDLAADKRATLERLQEAEEEDAELNAAGANGRKAITMYGVGSGSGYSSMSSSGASHHHGSSSSQQNAPQHRKISTTMIIFAACVLGLGLGLFGINYWHATKCSSDRSPDEIEDMVQALTRRLLEAESQIHKNEILMGKVIGSLQSNLLRIEQKEYHDLVQQSKDEAVKIALFLASHPAPPMPEFMMDTQFEDAEKLADVIDDVFGKSGQLDDKSTDFEGGLEMMDDKEVQEQEPQLSDSEAVKVCTEWQVKYNVVVGVSWGDLPYDLQQKWLAYSCDYHMKPDSKEADKGEESEII